MQKSRTDSGERFCDCVSVCVSTHVYSCVVVSAFVLVSSSLLVSLSPPFPLCLAGSICVGSQNPLPGQALVWEKNLILVRAKETYFNRAHWQERPSHVGMIRNSLPAQAVVLQLYCSMLKVS